MTETRRPTINKWIPILAAIGLISFLIYAFYSADFLSIVSVLAETNLPLYVLAFLMVSFDPTFTSLGWRVLLSKLDVRVTAGKALTLTWVGFFIDAIIPSGWSGDLFKAYLLSRGGDAKAGSSGASIVIQRMIIMSIALGNLVVGLTLLTFVYHLPSDITIPITIVATLFAFSIAMAIFITIKPKATRRIIKAIVRLSYLIRRKEWKSEQFTTGLEDTLATFARDLKVLSSRRRSLLRPIVMYILAWFSEIAALLIVFNAVGYPITIDKVMIVYSIGGALESQTAAFAGFSQIVTSTLYIILGIAPAISIAATLLIGFSGFWFKLSVSYVFFSHAVFRRNK
jgi:uncharacterized protein (TIRG00374 family)